MRYLVGLANAGEYSSSGIPHAWLISADGRLLWEGHPGSVPVATIEEELKNVRVVPDLGLSEKFKKVDAYLKAGAIAKALKDLERAEAGDDAAMAAEAKEAKAKLLAFGQKQLERAEAMGKEQYYADGLKILQELEKSFKGTEVGDKSGQRYDEWDKDKVIKEHIKAEVMMDQVDQLIGKAKQRDAYGLLMGIVKNKKLDGTRIQKLASEKADRIKGSL
ncbi:MAG: hypothetical protein AB7O52_17565 [Planctomycetota bacterium]